MNLDYLSVIAAFLAAIATIAAASTSVVAYRSQATVARRNQIMMQDGALIECIQEMIVLTANLRVLASQVQTIQRDTEIQKSYKKIKSNIVTAESLSTKFGPKLHTWLYSKGANGFIFSQAVSNVTMCYFLMHNKYDEFFLMKCKEIIKIRDELFLSIDQRSIPPSIFHVDDEWVK